MRSTALFFFALFKGQLRDTKGSMLPCLPYEVCCIIQRMYFKYVRLVLFDKSNGVVWHDFITAYNSVLSRTKCAYMVSQDLWCKSDPLTRALKVLKNRMNALRYVLQDVFQHEFIASMVELPSRTVLMLPLPKDYPRACDYVQNNTFEEESFSYLTTTIKEYVYMIELLTDANGQRVVPMRKLVNPLKNCRAQGMKVKMLLAEHKPPNNRKRLAI